MINTIYLDLDGVIADFDTYCVQLIGKSLYTFPDSQSGWDALGQYKDDIFINLQPMSDSFELVSSVTDIAKNKGYNIGVLTAVPKYGRVPFAKKHKMLWLQKHFPSLLSDFNIGPWAEDKQKHCIPGDILIDDVKLNIAQWDARGGIGIHHTSANNSIGALNLYFHQF